jgi:hypothetical protein
VLGPFGSWAIPSPQRLADWLLFAGGGYVCFRVCFRPVVWAGQVLADHSRLPLTVAVVVAGAFAALPTTLVVAWGLAGMAVTHVALASLAALYPEVLLIGLLVTAVQIAFGRHAAMTVGTPALVSPPAAEPPVAPFVAEDTTPFLDRLPPALGAELVALQQDDHYVRAHTALGSALILMRMRDAVAELADIDGARVHRSWWVARIAVCEVVRRERAVSLRLSNGLEAPVARAAVPKLRASGWM